MHEGPKDIWFGCTVKEFSVFIASLLYPGCHISAFSQLLLLKSVVGLCALTHAAKMCSLHQLFPALEQPARKNKKTFSPIHVAKFVPRGCLSVFSYFSDFENCSQGKKKHQGCKKKR